MSIYDELIAEEELKTKEPIVPAKPTVYDEILGEEEGKSRTVLKTSFQNAKDSNPDAFSKALKISQDVNLDPSMIERNLPEVEKNLPLMTFQPEALIKDSPVTASFLSDTNNLKLSKDDIDALRDIESFRRIEDTAEYFNKPFLEKAGGRLTEEAKRGVNAAITNIQAVVDQYSKVAGIPPAKGAIPGLAIPIQNTGVPLVDVGLSLGNFFRTLGPEKTRELGEFIEGTKLEIKPTPRLGGLEGYGLDVVGIVPQVAATIGTTLATGSPVAGGAVMWQFIFGVTYEEQLRKGVDKDRAAVAAVFNATTQAWLEGISLTKLLKHLGGPARGFKHTLRSFFELLGTESGVEATQEPVETIADIFGSGAGKSFGEMADEFIKRGPETLSNAGYAALVMLPFGVAGGGAKFFQFKAQAQVLNQDIKDHDALAKAAEASKLRERAPGQLEQHIDASLAKEDVPQHFSINLDSFKRFFQDDADGLAKMAKDLGIEEQVADAELSGKEIEILKSAWATRYSGTPLSVAIKKDIRYRPEGMTENEVEAERKVLQKNVEETQAEIAKLTEEEKLPPQLAQIRQTLMTPKKEGGAGYSAADADLQLAITVEGAQRLSRHRGETAAQWFERINLQVNTGGEFVAGGAALAQTETALSQEATTFETVGEFIGSKEIFFHGTRKKFDEFNPSKKGETTGLAGGIYFTKDKDLATIHSGATSALAEFREGSRVVEVVLDIQNPAPRKVITELFGEGKDFSEIIPELKKRGYDAIVKPDETIVFSNSQVKTKAQLTDIFNRAKGQPLLQEDRRNLSVVHGLTAENLLFSDRLGGLAAPSLAVFPEDKTLEAYGDITLIGKKDLADPKKTPVFDADAYTATFPRAQYAKVKVGIVDKLVERIRPYAGKFASQFSITNFIQQEMRDAMNPSPDKLVGEALRDNAFKAMYLKEVLNQDVDPILKAKHLRAGAISKNKKVRAFFKDLEEKRSKARDEADAFEAKISKENEGKFRYQWPEADNAKLQELQLKSENFSVGKEAVDKQLTPILKAAINDLYKNQKGGVKEVLVESMTNQLFDEKDGHLFFGPANTIQDDQQSVGKKAVDVNAVEKVLDEKLKGRGAKYKEWVENLIVPSFGEPFLKFGRKKGDYNLENIVKQMRQNRAVQGEQTTMVFGEGNARAAAAIQFSNIEEMRKAAANIESPKDVNAAREKAKKLMNDWREKVIDYYRFQEGLRFDARDDSMRSIAQAARRGMTEAALRSALAKNDFDNVPNHLIEEGVAAGEAFMQAPVPYFEAKPQRAVAIEEFAGAVVPSDVDPKVLEVLKRRGVPIRQYGKSGDRAGQAQAVSEFRGELAAAGQEVLFQAQQNADTFFSKSIEVSKGLPAKVQGEAAMAFLINKGVKKEELETAGLGQWLAAKKGAIPQADITQFLTENQTKVTDVILSQDAESVTGTGETDTEADREAANEARESAEEDAFETASNQVFEEAGSEGKYVGEIEWEEVTKDEGTGPLFPDETIKVKHWFERLTEAQIRGLEGGGYALSFSSGYINPTDQFEDVYTDGFEVDASELEFETGQTEPFHYPTVQDAEDALAGYLNDNELLISEDERLERGAEIVEGIMRDFDNRQEDEQETRGGDPTKFSDYVLPGDSSNYREILLTLPREDTKAAAQTQYNRLVGEGTPAFEAREIVDVNFSKAEPFTGGHFKQNNVTAHVRLTDRVDADGNKMLFIEEIQSDWHQKGRQQGYRSTPTPVPIRDEEVAITQTEHQYVAAFVGQEPLGIGKGTVNSEEAAQAYARNYWNNQRRDSLANINERVPDAPFKDSWQDIAMKRMLRYAAENGYDKIGWTTGEQQVDRYGSALRDRVDVIDWEKTPEGVQIIGIKNGGEVANTRYKETELSDAIGKSMADQIKADPGQTGSIKGEDITISKTWPALFYDVRIPSFVKKYTKKWGMKPKVEQIVTRDTGGKTEVLSAEGLVVNTYGGNVNEIANAENEARKIGGAIRRVDTDSEDIHTLELTQDMKEAVLTGGQPLFQEGQDKIRGSVKFTDQATIINLYKSANMSTFLHEIGHVFMKDMKGIVDAGLGDEQLKRDLNTLQSFAGDINTQEGQEKLARGFEAYLREGKAPSVRLAEAFNRFREWLTSIYRSIRGLNVEISPEIRGVFDRLLASEEEIREAQDYYKAKKDVTALIPQTPKQREDLEKKKRKAELTTLEKQTKTRLNAYLSVTGGRAALRDQAAKQVDNSPVYKVIADGRENGGITTTEVEAAYGKEAVQTIKKRHPKLLKKDGKLSIAQLAATYNFTSDATLLEALTKAPSRKDAVNIATAALEAQKEAEIRTDLEAQEVVPGVEAIHNDASLTYLIAQAEILSKELARKRGSRAERIEARIYKDAARDIISSKKVKAAARYDLYAKAEERYAKEALTAVERGDLQASHQAKKKQILNHALVQEAIKARDQKASIEDRYMAANLKSKLKSVENAYAQAALDLVSTYGLSTSPNVAPTSKDAVANLATMDEVWYGQTPSWIVGKQKPKDFKTWRDLTMQQLRDLDSSIKALIKYGGDELSSLEDERYKTVTDIVDKSVEIGNNLKNKAIFDEFTIQGKLMKKLDGLLAQTKIVEFLFERLDNYEFTRTKLMGPLRTLFKRGVKAESDFDGLRTRIMEKAKPQWDTLFDATKRLEKQFGGQAFDVPGLPMIEDMKAVGRFRWTSERLIAFILNLGNEGNFNALTNSYGYTQPQIDIITGLFNEKELRAIQNIWDITNELYPEMDKTYFSMYNRHTEKVEGTPLQLVSASGKLISLKGGYYPLQFDHTINDQAARNQESRDAREADIMANRQNTMFRKTKPEDGFSYSRTPGHSLPPNLTLSVWFSHIADTARYISHAEYMRDLNRVTLAPTWRTMVRQKAGRPAYEAIRSWVSYQAIPERRPMNPWDQFLDKQRSLATLAILGANISVGIKQRLSMLSAGKAIGWKWIFNGVTQMDFKSSVMGIENSEKWQKVLRLSPYMKARRKAIDREIRDSQGKFSPFTKRFNIGGKDFTLKDVQDFMFEWIQMNDRAAVGVVWTGAFNQFMEEKFNFDETEQQNTDNAAAYADAIIRTTQPSALPIDLNALQRSEGPVRLFTAFMTWSFKYGNRLGAENQAWKDGAISNQEYFRHFIYEVLMTSWGAMIVGTLLRGETPEPQDWATSIFSTLVSWVPILRDLYGYYTFRKDIGTSTAFEGLNRYAKAAWAVKKSTLGDQAWSRTLWDIGRAGEFTLGVPALNLVHQITRFYKNALK